MRFWRNTPKKRNVRKPKKRVVPTYRGMGMSLTSSNHLSVEQEKEVLDSMVQGLLEDRDRLRGKRI
jgi:hypothetical protein